MVDVRRRGGAAEGEDAARGEGVGDQTGFDEVGVDLFELSHRGALCVYQSEIGGC